MQISFFALLLLTSTYLLVLSSTGIDISGLYSKDIFSCMTKNNIVFAIPRAYHSYGAVDTNAITNLNNARQAGLTTDIYMFPCAGKSPSDQVNELLNAIPQSLFGQIWIDVEENSSTGCEWSTTNYEQNCKFLQDLVSSLKSHTVEVGMYVSHRTWLLLFGNVTYCSDFSDLKLWYAHYDDNPSFSDWVSYGGWTKPTMKQYKGDASLCDADVDVDYLP